MLISRVPPGVEPDVRGDSDEYVHTATQAILDVVVIIGDVRNVIYINLLTI